MDGEWTLGDIYEEIAEKLALARTRALMGEREEALGIFRGAALEFTRFREVLHGYPGYLALEHAFEVTMASLGGEAALQPARTVKPRTGRSRRKIREAA